MEDLKKREQELIAELDEYNREREKIREILGKIGGKRYSRTDTILNILFLAIIVALFILEITTHLFPVLISIEVGILLVSVKIVWMIHSQQQFNHFQFWVLNSMEFRVNEMTRRMRNIEKNIESLGRGKEPFNQRP
jgi:Flp pilus assembly protein TadB